MGQAPAIIRLIGSEGQSEEYVLGACRPVAPKAPCFRRHVCAFARDVPPCTHFILTMLLLAPRGPQATTRTSMALSAARGVVTRWTSATAWARSAACLCSRCVHASCLQQ